MSSHHTGYLDLLVFTLLRATFYAHNLRVVARHVRDDAPREKLERAADDLSQIVDALTSAGAPPADTVDDLTMAVFGEVITRSARLLEADGIKELYRRFHEMPPQQ